MLCVRALNWSPVPLLRVFEIRDVDWARLVMATFSILGLSLALLEVCTPLYALVVCLSGEYVSGVCLKEILSLCNG
jgi:hypothetical protein